jgi:hypothetical protein
VHEKFTFILHAAAQLNVFFLPQASVTKKFGGASRKHVVTAGSDSSIAPLSHSRLHYRFDLLSNDTETSTLSALFDIFCVICVIVCLIGACRSDDSPLLFASAIGRTDSPREFHSRPQNHRHFLLVICVPTRCCSTDCPAWQRLPLPFRVRALKPPESRSSAEGES